MNRIDVWITHPPDGDPQCPKCGSDAIDEDDCGWMVCMDCNHVLKQGFDPDEAYDRAREER